MPQEPDDGKRFAHDMRSIREERNLTVGDVHNETKIPQGLIQAFEEKALFDHPQFNRVYLRSFVRTYAQVIEIDADVALEGLEEALSGRYVGSLAVAYLGEEPESPPGVVESEEGSEPATAAPPDSETADDVDEEAGAIEAVEDTSEEELSVTEDDGAEADTSQASGQKREPAESPEVDDDEREPDAETPPAETAERTTKLEDAPPKEESPSYVSTTQAAAAGFQQLAEEHEEPEEESDEWTNQSPPSDVSKRSSQGHRQPEEFDRRWLVGGALVVVVGILVWVLSSVIGGDDGPSTPPATSDGTVEAVEEPDSTPPSQPAQAISVPTLGDSMAVHIVASNGRVDPIRVTVDQDLRRPYWIDQGDSITFHPTSRIVIEELLDSVNVQVEGITYPMDRLDAQGRLVITRDSAESFFATLGGAQ